MTASPSPSLISSISLSIVSAPHHVAPWSGLGAGYFQLWWSSPSRTHLRSLFASTAALRTSPTSTSSELVRAKECGPLSWLLAAVRPHDSVHLRSGSFHVLVFPEPDHGPTGGSQLGIRVAISTNVRLELRCPPLAVLPAESGVVRAGCQKQPSTSAPVLAVRRRHPAAPHLVPRRTITRYRNPAHSARRSDRSGGVSRRPGSAFARGRHPPQGQALSSISPAPRRPPSVDVMTTVYPTLRPGHPE